MCYKIFLCSSRISITLRLIEAYEILLCCQTRSGWFKGRSPPAGAWGEILPLNFWWPCHPSSRHRWLHRGARELKSPQQTKINQPTKTKTTHNYRHEKNKVISSFLPSCSTFLKYISVFPNSTVPSLFRFPFPCEGVMNFCPPHLPPRPPYRKDFIFYF